MSDLVVRTATEADLDEVKQLFDEHRTELGFVLRPSLVKSIQKNELIVAFQDNVVVGAVHFHHRRDGQTTLYHIAVRPIARHNGVGTALIRALSDRCIAGGSKCILLKCPSELSANAFYVRIGFVEKSVEPGKHRELNVWVMEIE